jgi:soluble lytic murein transglycosylase
VRALGIARDDARRLERGDSAFLFNCKIAQLRDVANIDPSAPFYAALQVEANSALSDDAQERVETLLLAALASPITRVAAAEKLIAGNPEHYYTRFLNNPAPALGTTWETAFTLRRDAANPNTRDKVITYLFDAPAFEKPQRWLAAHLSTMPETNATAVSWRVLAAYADARSAVSLKDYAGGLEAFNRARNRPNATEFLYAKPRLLADYGKALQYAAPAAGEKAFSAAQNNSTLSSQAQFVLAFYRGRFARSRKKYAAALTHFTNAVKNAPDNEQRDATIWYILDCAYNDNNTSVPALVKTYAPQWSDGAYFDDILDAYSAWAAGAGAWQALYDMADPLIQHASPATSAKYAYIAGRIAALGYLAEKPKPTPKKAKRTKKKPAKQKKAPPQTLPTAADATRYFEAAYNAGKHGLVSPAVVYYRLRAAEQLHKPLNLNELLAVEKPAVTEGVSAPVFLRNFFVFGAAKWAAVYIEPVLGELSMEARWELFDDLERARQWRALVMLAIRSAREEGGSVTRRGLEFLFPRGYRARIERVAEQNQIDAAVLFSLARQESVFDAGAVSRSGARGLMQLMEATGNAMAEEFARKGGPDFRGPDGRVNLLDPDVNLPLGARYYAKLHAAFKSDLLASIAYNSGIGRVRRWRRNSNLADDLFLESIPITETRNYGRLLLGGAALYRFLYYDKTKENNNADTAKAN